MKKIHENLILRGRSENTFIGYRSALNTFFKYFDSNTNIVSFNENDILNYVNDCFIKTNKSKNTYNIAICSIRLLFMVCFNKGLSSMLLPTSKRPMRLPSIITKDDFLKIFNYEKHLRHKCWLLLAFCSGLRVHEVAKVKVEDINSKDHKLKVLGKGNKERYTILPDVTIKILRLYCKEKNIKSGYLFQGLNKKEVMCPTSIINYFSTIKDIYNLKESITFHSLRHSFATYYLMNGGDLLTLKSMLGHKSLTSTTIYIHMSQDFNNLKGIDYAK